MSGHLQRLAIQFGKIPHRTRRLCLALVLLSGGNAACFAQTITIRIVNLTNGKPVKNVKIYVAGINGSATPERDERRRLLAKPIDADLSLTTAANGEVSFSLPRPAPASFYIRALLSGPHWDCTCHVHVITQDLVQKGRVVMSPYGERRHSRVIPPEPGEILLGLRPLPLWVRIFWPVLKG